MHRPPAYGKTLRRMRGWAQRIQWPAEYVKTELVTYPVVSGIPHAFLAYG
jgi:hypothetical protein